jgi:hypothetical protein
MARRQDPIRYRATRRAWVHENKDRPASRRRTRLKRRYAISPEQVIEMLEKQNYKCLICLTPISADWAPKQPEGYTKAVIDHSHKDGHVRGLLCSACNSGLGLFEDSLKYLRAAFHYLKADVIKRKAEDDDNSFRLFEE